MRTRALVIVIGLVAVLEACAARTVPVPIATSPKCATGTGATGTGDSGPLDCSGVSGWLRTLSSVATCARELGQGRGSYRTADSVADIEALRVAGGYQRLVLYGVSYGTAVALAYAATYPDHVERLVLDSVVDPQENDPFDLTE